MTQSSSVSTTQSILPIRFTIKEHAFEHTGAHILAVDWMNDARKVLEMLATQNKTKSGKVYLPTVSLDTALSTINPVVAHGYRAMDDRHHFTLIVNKDELPNPSLIATLGSKWAEVWSERHFPDRLAHPEFRYLHQRIASVVDWQEISAHAALYDASNEKLRYSVIPSVLSALFAAGGPSQLGGQNVTWGLSQQSECNGWQVVSSPLSASNGSTFAYLIRFSVQYQPGIADPRIHAAIICQRYADRPVKDSGGRNISFLCRLGQPLMAQEGSWNDNLIRLVASTNAIDGMSFGPGLPEILRRAQARVLASPADILADPLCFRGEQPGSDRYLVVHFEGLETELDSDEDDEEAAQTSGKHGIGTGFSLTERWEIYQTIAERLAQFLKPSGPLPRVDTGRALRSVAAWSRASGGAKPDRYLDAFRTANHGETSILLLHRGDGVGEVMEFFTQRMFYLGKDDAWPDWMKVSTERIPDELGRELEIPKEGADSLANRRAEAERKMSDAWYAFLQKHKAKRLYVWAELPTYKEFTSPHHAIRNACVRLEAASQMFTPLRVASPAYLMDMMHKRMHRFAQKDFGRMFNAVADLVLRQSGTTRLGELARDARVAGFPKEFSDQLRVVGITVFRANTNNRAKRGEVTLPIAVRMNPDGVMQVFWENQWIDYYEATMRIGKLFSETERGVKVCLEKTVERNKRINDYFQHMMQAIRDTPTLLIIDAVKTRSFVKSMKVMELRRGTILVGGTEFNQITHPQLVAVWARFDSPAENIQYVGQGDEGGLEKVADQSLFMDNDAEGVFKHYYSLGRQLPGMEDLDDGYRPESPTLRYRYQQAIELIPIFGNEDLLKPAIILAHGLRSGPHFTISSLTAPYPIHLATAMLSDLVCLLGVMPGETEE